ncbi:MAG: hypothetical protein ACYC9Y_06850 [Candidatus Methylomirabilia bacterium]
MTKPRKMLLYTVLALFGAAMPAASPAAQPAPQIAAAVATPSIIPVTPQLTMSALAERPDSDLVQLTNGRRINVGSLRRLKAAQVRMQAALPGSRLAPALLQKPAATGTPVGSAAELAAALKRPGTDTVRFPSGRTATVDQIKFLQPFVEQRLGRSLSSQTLRQSSSGAPIKITKATNKGDWLQILKLPADTLLEAPDGRRMSVGALKLSLASPPPRGTLKKTVPAAVPLKQ